MNKISQNILDSCNLLIEQKIKELKFDRTILASIVDVKDDILGCYQVKYMDVIFDAYAAQRGIIYKKDDLVYIRIPENDFSNRKIIEYLYQ